MASRSTGGPKSAEVAAERIGELILSENLAAGDMLPNEAELTRLLGVSRPTLREALRLLEAHGVVSIRTGRGGGPVVQRPGPADFARSIRMMLQFLDVPFREVVVARELLEPIVVAEAAARVTPRDLRWFADNLEDQKAVIGDDERFHEANDRFHERIVHLSSNSVLGVIAVGLESVTASLDLTIRYPPRTQQRIVRAHQRIVEALSSGDVEAAAAEGRQHVLEFRRHLERHHPELLDRPVRWMAGRGNGGTATALA